MVACKRWSSVKIEEEDFIGHQGQNIKYRSKGHHPQIYPNHKNDVRLEFLAFSPFQRYLTFPDWTTNSKDMVS